MGEMTNEGQSRRDLIKKGAVAGGIVWAAPILLSSPAAAGQADGSAVFAISNVIVRFTCTVDGTPTTFVVKRDGGGNTTVLDLNGGNSCISDAQTHSGDGTGLVSFTPFGTGSVTATVGSNCIINEIVAKCGTACNSGGSTGGQTATVTDCPR